MICSTRRLFTLVALGAVPLAAQQATDMEKELEALLNTPIQGASKREQRLIDSPQAIEVLTGDEIRAMGIYRLVDALKLMTSVDVLELNNHVTNVALRGSMQQGQPKTVQILVDGVPLYNAEIASVDLDNLPVVIDMIDKVEVVRGPSSSLYGANAVVGVIAITTKRAPAGLKGGARLSRADKGTWRGETDLSFTEGSLGLVAGYQGASIGVSNDATTFLTTGAPVVLDRDSSHQRQSFARLDYKLGEKSTLWLGTGEANKYFGTYAAAVSPYQTFTTRTVNAGWGSTWMEGFRTELRWSHMLQRYSFGPTPAFIPVFNEPALANEYAWADFYSDLVELQVNYDASKTVHLVGGLDHRFYGASKSAIIGFPSDYTEGASGGFLNADWNATDTLTFSAGARLENETIGGSRTSPRFAVVWNPTKASSLRGGFYSSTRSPQIAESRVNFYNPGAFVPPPPLPPPPASRGDFRIIPNPGLEPEKVTSTEIGYRHIFGAFTLDATFFEMKFKKLIAQVQQGAPSVVIGAPIVVTVTNQYVNTGDATDKGLELAGSWRLSPRWTFGANATWLDYKLETTQSTPSYAPSFKGNAWARLSLGAFSGHLSFQHIGRVNMEVLSVAGTASAPVQREAINQANLNLGWEFMPGGTLSVYSRNALKEYTEQGGGGPTRFSALQPARRESGITLGYRF